MNFKIEDYLKKLEKYKKEFRAKTGESCTVDDVNFLYKHKSLSYAIINTDETKIDAISTSALESKFLNFKIIGVTGQSGAGKTTFCKKFKSLGRKIINADEIAHAILKEDETVKKEIVNYFGRDVLNKEEEIVRPKLKKMVISSKSSLPKLNEIMFKPIALKIISDVKRHLLKNKKVVLDAPLLLKYNLHKICDFVVLLTYNGRRSRWK